MIDVEKIDAETARKIEKQCNTGDKEEDHGRADQLLLDLLHAMGFTKTVEAFSKLEKWYA